MIAAIILHNMITEDERTENDDAFLVEDGFVPFRIIPGTRIPYDNQQRRSINRQTRSNDQHLQLQSDLVDHLWNLKGNNEERENQLP